MEYLCHISNKINLTVPFCEQPAAASVSGTSGCDMLGDGAIVTCRGLDQASRSVPGSPEFYRECKRRVQDFDDLRAQYYHGIITPSDVNNVDVTVSANALYGITNGILSGLVTTEVLEDPEIQQLYLNTSTMIAFQINTNFSGRPDLALTYYPSVMEFYWFVARTYAQLTRRYRAGSLPHNFLITLLDKPTL
uniref:Uncharacterized protein n=1 Tax=Magallana gigas TaxID=29159 RepID=K1Q665_MAGGI